MELTTGYKQTEVGVIPEDWDAVPLGKLCAFKTGPFGSALHKSDYTSGGIPLVNPMHIVDGRISPSDNMTITAQAARKLSDFLLRRGDIVIGRRGDMGRCAVVGEAEDGWLCGTGSMIVRTVPSADPAFFQRVLSSPPAIGKITDSSVGSTMVNLNQGTLRGLVVQAPPLEEQRTIAVALSDADELIASMDTLIAKKRELKRAAMQQLLTGKTRLPGFGKGKGIKQTDLGEIPEDWCIAKVGDVLVEISMGPFGSDIKVSNFISDGVPVLSGENIRTHVLKDGFRNFVTYQKAKSLKKAVASRGDLVVTHRGTIGQIAYIPDSSAYENYVISQSQFRARFKDEVKPIWVALFFLSESGATKLLEGKGHTGVPAIAQATTTFRKLHIPLPSKDEQAAIAAVLSDMDADVANLESQCEKARAIRQGMTQALLIGRIRLV
ncbi:MAG: restriction endonuclease subunit S [Mesorhizobium sp.]|uniref:restriction endonuclease subunit S n=1 Tax=Mesorhizobium sp. TaxID=1871066 RepID=UPI000FE5F371|nr:restriction endonuclease subunit S [Mesorhizobium sp.]RWN31095.1 MAG: restriction endonuclease subunit S [Mesorhizobium sp.]